MNLCILLTSQSFFSACKHLKGHFRRYFASNLLPFFQKNSGNSQFLIKFYGPEKLVSVAFNDMIYNDQSCFKFAWTLKENRLIDYLEFFTKNHCAQLSHLHEIE